MVLNYPPDLSRKKSSREYSLFLKKLVVSLKRGQVLILPTDTVYDLVALAKNKEAVEKIFKIKKRLKTNPLPIFVENLAAAKKIAVVNQKQARFLREVWPGKVTVVLKRKTKRGLYGLAEKTIALRLPKYKLVNDLLSKIKLPLVATSANLSDWPATGKIREVLRQLQSGEIKPDLVVDAGNLEPAKPSSVIDLSGKIVKVLRR
jgi:L-threonylcarbamoyladenylate synthase